eukprot:9526043-Prorocentrum_lima.AAC.1
MSCTTAGRPGAPAPAAGGPGGKAGTVDSPTLLECMAAGPPSGPPSTGAARAASSTRVASRHTAA